MKTGEEEEKRKESENRQSIDYLICTLKVKNIQQEQTNSISSNRAISTNSAQTRYYDGNCLRLVMPNL